MRTIPIPPAFMYSASLGVSGVCGPMPKNSAGARGGWAPVAAPPPGASGEDRQEQGGGERGCQLSSHRRSGRVATASLLNTGNPRM